MQTGQKTAPSKRHICVTGASSGLGYAIARQYLQSGFRVTLLARREDRMALLVEEYPERAQFFILDVTDLAAVQSVLQYASQKWGPIDTVYANAGIGLEGRVEDQSVLDFKRQLDVNFWGVLHTFYASLPDLKKTKGRFAITGSVSGYISLPTSVGYAVSKYAVRALAEGLYAELGSAGVSVTLISPGFIATEIRGPNDPVPRWLQMPVAVAARKAVRAVERRSRERVITAHGWLIHWIARLAMGPLLRLLRLSSRQSRAGVG